MKPSELRTNIWYCDRLGKQWRAIYISGNTVRYEDQRGNVGDMPLKKFAAKCILEMGPAS